MIYLTLLLLLTTVVVPQSDYFTAKLDHLTATTDQLIQDFHAMQRKFSPKVRSRLIILLLELIPTEVELSRLKNDELQEKFDSITMRLQREMHISYPRLRRRISQLLIQLLGSTLIPFTIMQAPSQEEIQQALFPFRTIPSRPGSNSLPTSSTLPINLQNSSDDRTSFNVPQPEHVLIARKVPRQPQLTQLRMNLHPQQYESTISERYYMQTQPRPQYLSHHEQLAPRWYWQRPQQQKPHYWSPYPDDSTAYGQNSIISKRLR